MLAHAARAGGRVLAIVVAALLAGAILFGTRAQDVRGRSVPLEILEQARKVATPDAGLAVAGPDRVAVAVYARLGHAPPMPLMYVPENAAPDALAALCRRNAVRTLWFHPEPVPRPAGFAAAPARTAQAPLLAPIVLEGR